MWEAVLIPGLLLGEIGLTDLLPRYGDYTKKVALMLDDGARKVPLAVLEQYKAVDVFDSLGGNDSLRARRQGMNVS